MKHVELLREAGLIHTREERRQRINSLNVVPIRQIYLLRIKEEAEGSATGAHVAEAQTKKRPKGG
jgi:DNA-binding transcriptional ArsR family regulator